MKFQKVSTLFRRKSRSLSRSNAGSGSSSSSSFESRSTGSSSKSPLVTPKTVLSSTDKCTVSALKVSAPQPTKMEICLEEPSYVRRNTNYALPLPLSSSPSSSTGAATLLRVDELHEVFKVFDADRDGKISMVELGCVLRSLGDDLSDDELGLMVRDADKDGDGYIDLDEFITLNTVGFDSGMPATDDLRDAFYIFDADKNGLISAEELHRVLTSLGDAACTIDECRRMIKGVDEDGDGCVNFEEFRRMMTC